MQPLADYIFELPPTERDEMGDWLLDNYPPFRKKMNPSIFTAYAPADIAGKYAVGDVDRTWLLYKLFDKMLSSEEKIAYEREKAVVPIVLDMEAYGVRIDVDRLEKDHKKSLRRQGRLSDVIYKRLGDINPNSPQQMAKALYDHGVCKEFLETPTGKPSVSIPALRETAEDQGFIDVLEEHSKYKKLIGTYMSPWLEAAYANDGYFFPYFNPTRKDAETGGAYTGRFSSNFQQVPKRRFGKLPYMRDYVLPDKGQVIVDRDYSQQELRILADGGGGNLAKAYVDDPTLDMHNFTMDLVSQYKPITRDQTKTINFLKVYGGGAPLLAKKLSITETEAREIIKAHTQAIPEVKQLSDRLKREHADKGCITTWGGRRYQLPYEDHYKLLNLYIQGSAADQTKEVMIRYEAMRGNSQARVMLTVHDQILLSAPGKGIRASNTLRRAMEDMPGWHVPMLTDAKVVKSWTEATE